MNATYIEPFEKKLRGDALGNMAAYRTHPHRGQDWHPLELSPIKAITKGTVTANEWSDALGWILVHRTFDGLFVLYAHMAEQSSKKIGDIVSMGDIIGRVGGGKHKSGNASTGAHLHLAIASHKLPHLCLYEKLIDPIKHIENNAAQAAPKPKKAAIKK
jgi:murein DD-endopeptidase MepM/ murein hydrolase activator NlpD